MARRPYLNLKFVTTRSVFGTGRDDKGTWGLGDLGTGGLGDRDKGTWGPGDKEAGRMAMVTYPLVA